MMPTPDQVPPAVHETWHETRWRGERAYYSFSGSGRWRALVSVDRARLVEFGPGDRPEINLLWVPDDRTHPAGWGGHRLWLGPQKDWPGGWPPPAAWEKSPGIPSIKGGTLTLKLPKTGNPWPDLVRTYRWDGEALVCGARIHEGEIPAQVVHIFQMPVETKVKVDNVAEVAGTFVDMIHLAQPGKSEAVTVDALPPHLEREGAGLVFRHLGVAEKLGFLPRPLRGRIHGLTLTVDRGVLDGLPCGEPDKGFDTHLFLGSHEPFVELEQLSPLLKAGTPGRGFEAVIRGE